ncbi:MAG: circadian clock protein KaiC [Candidatus Eisenbacteria bacterium]|nr:circadian clock protein KaiC [Candidatus Eisenbacteria bacterium]
MLDTQRDGRSLERLPVGIDGFDAIAHGGLPAGRTTLLTGSAGSGKTIFAIQFLVAGIRRYGQGGVLVTFEESPVDLERNAASLGWDLSALTAEESLAVVDGSPVPGEEVIQAGGFNLTSLMARIESAVKQVNAKRVIMDSIGSVFPHFSDANIVRRELSRIISGMRRLGVTVVLTGERLDVPGSISRYGVEEYVTDNVIILRNSLEGEKRRRSIEILKMRGSDHQKGEYPYVIESDHGLTIIPVAVLESRRESSNCRISSGIKDLDSMCGGGLFSDSVVLVSGATGTGKTLMVTEFMRGAVADRTPALLFAFEEDRHQLIRNATSWGVDFRAEERAGLLRIVDRLPETMGLAEYLLRMRREMDEFKPGRIAVDSLSALERVSTPKAFREFVMGLTSYTKSRGIAAMLTSTTSMLMGGDTITEAHISTIADAIILLRYVELHGEIRRGAAVLKMRGSFHEKRIHEYHIDGRGMSIVAPFCGIKGILSGDPSYSFKNDPERLGIGNPQSAEDRWAS